MRLIIHVFMPKLQRNYLPILYLAIPRRKKKAKTNKTYKLIVKKKIKTHKKKQIYVILTVAFFMDIFVNKPYKT